VYCSEDEAAVLLAEACNTSKPLPSWKVEGGSTREMSGGGNTKEAKVGYADSCPSEHAKVSEPEAREKPPAATRLHEAPEGSSLVQLPKAACKGTLMRQEKPMAVGGTKASVELIRQRTMREPPVSE